MKKKILACLLILFPIFSLGMAKADTVKIVSDTAYAPFEFKDSDQTYKGIDVDIINKVAEIKGWNIQMSYPGFDAAVNAVQSGQADAIMAGMTKTKERENVFTMSDTYYDTKVVIATTKANKITKYEELSGKTVGVKNGTAAQRFLESIKDKYGFSIKTFDTGDLMNNSLSAGAVNAIMDDKPVIEYAINQGQDLSINMDGEAVGSFAFGVKKGSKYEHLVTEFNEALAQMKKDGSLEQIIQKWTASTTTASPTTTTAAGQKATPVKSKYIIASDSSFAPFVFQNSSNQYTGIDMDLIKAIAKDQGFEIEITNPGFDAAISAVQAGQADGIIAGMSVTDARKETFDFSESYYTANTILGVKESSTIASYEDLKDKTVGVKNGTAAQRFLETIKDKYGFTIKTFDTGDLMNNSLTAGAIDAMMDDKPVIEYAINQGQDLHIEMDGEAVGSFAFGVKKGSKYEHLVTEFNQALAEMKKDGSLDKIIKKWTASSSSAVPTTTTAAGLKATPVKAKYIIASDSSFAPFVFQNSSNQFTGIDMDLIKAIAKDQGFEIEITNPGFDAAISAVQAGQADGIIAGMSVTDARKATFDFSESYYTANTILGVKESSSISSYEDLKGKTVGVKNGTASQTFLTENQSKYGYKIKTFADGSSMYDSLNTGAIDAVMDDEPVLKYSISQGQKLKTPISGTPIGETAFAVKKGANPELIEMFNNGLANLKANGEFQKILDKYLASESSSASTSTVDETTIWGLLQNNYKQLLSGLGITLALALISFAIAIVIGIIFGMFSVSPYKSLRVISEIFVDVIRGIPLMILAAFIFWGIPNFIESITGQQSPINDFVAGTIALSLNAAAYIAEIVRGGIQAVPVGQMEASRSLGISYGKTMRKIILPQATKLMLPNFVNQFVIALKDTTIVSAIGLVELFQTGKIIIARNYQSFKMYAILAIFYLVIITLLTKLAKRLEKRIR